MKLEVVHKEVTQSVLYVGIELLWQLKINPIVIYNLFQCFNVFMCTPQTTNISCSFANLKCNLIQIAERKFAMGQWFEFKKGHQKKISSNFIDFD